MIFTRRAHNDSRYLLLSSHQQAITMRNIYRFLYVLPLLVTALFITGCDSEEETPPLPPIVEDTPTTDNPASATGCRKGPGDREEGDRGRGRTDQGYAPTTGTTTGSNG